MATQRFGGCGDSLWERSEAGGRASIVRRDDVGAVPCARDPDHAVRAAELLRQAQLPMTHVWEPGSQIGLLMRRLEQLTIVLEVRRVEEVGPLRADRVRARQHLR